MLTYSDNSFYCGTSGIAMPVPKALYPEPFRGKSRLTYYASFFNSIEINSSFYKLPKAFTVIKWRDMVPQNFRFTFKLSKSISHSKGLEFNAGDVRLFVQTINNVEHKKGCILIQFPPSLKPEKIKQVKELFTAIVSVNAEHAWKVAVEFRSNLWYTDETFKLLQQYNFSLVLHDLPASATPLLPQEDLVYLRFHGTEKGYRGSYDNTVLKAYAERIRQWTSEGKLVYCYFNNTLGSAFENLQALRCSIVP